MNHSKEITNKICNKYFPKSLNGKDVIQWFNDVNERYFSTFAGQLIELYNEKKSLILNIEKILEPIINKYKFQRCKKELLQGYREFLISKEREEEEKIWNLMQSLLSAKILSADLSPDFLNIDKYKNADILLDTNILFANSLASNRGLDDTVQSFGKVTKIIGAKLYITKETEVEYEMVCLRKKEEMLKLWQTYSINILLNSDRHDGFFRSLIDLGCETQEDISRFFDAVQQIPEEIGGAIVRRLNERDYVDVRYEQGKDKPLFEEIKSIWSEIHPGGWAKPEFNVIHDLLLTKICRKFGNIKKVFILTLDMSLERLALSWVNEKEEPIWRSLFSLVQILAINGGGPNFEASDMAPLVKIFIEEEDSCRSDDYDKRDLLFLSEMSGRIKELSDTKIESLLNKIHYARMQSNSSEQSLKDIKLELERSLIKNSHDLSQSLEEKDGKITELSDKNQNLKQENTKLKKFIDMLFFMVRTIICFAVSFFLFIILGSQIKQTISFDGLTYEVIQMILFIFTPLWIVWGDYQKIRNKIRNY